MKGKWNPKTKRYENSEGFPMQEKDITSGDKTYLDRYAEELRVKPADLLKNLLENNSLSAFSNCKSYSEFKTLSQTLVPESPLKQALNDWGSALHKTLGL